MINTCNIESNCGINIDLIRVWPSSDLRSRRSSWLKLHLFHNLNPKYYEPFLPTKNHKNINFIFEKIRDFTLLLTFSSRFRGREVNTPIGYPLGPIMNSGMSLMIFNPWKVVSALLSGFLSSYINLDLHLLLLVFVLLINLWVEDQNPWYLVYNIILVVYKLIQILDERCSTTFEPQNVYPCFDFNDVVVKKFKNFIFFSFSGFIFLLTLEWMRFTPSL